MPPGDAERRIRCAACKRLFLVSQLAEHQRRCPEMARLDEQIPDRAENLRK